MSDFDRKLPLALRELHRLEFDLDDGIDFDPFSEFLSTEETSDWLRRWTGNDRVDGSEYRVFGQDGSGGYAAVWCVRKGADLLSQPIVFFGSEGQLGVVAANFADYLWLLAGGIGPFEAVAYSESEGKLNPAFDAFARRHAGSVPRRPQEVLTKAREEFPTFVDGIQAVCG